jgi:hypothetical protein
METFPDDPVRQLEAGGRGYVEYAVEHPGVIHLMFGGGLDLDNAGEELREACSTAFEQLLAIVENGEQAGHYRPESSLNLTYACWSMAHGLSLLVSSGPLKSVRNDAQQFAQLYESVFTTLLQGMAVRD